MLFSATWSADVQTVALALCRASPVVIRVGDKGVEENSHVRSEIEQEVIVTDWPDNMWQDVEKRKKLKLEIYVRRVLLETEDNQVIIFVATRTYADELCNKLWDSGFNCDSIHSGKRQYSRNDVMERFRS